MNSNDEQSSKKNTRDHRKSYTCSFKLKVVDYAEKYSNSKAAELYSVHRRRVQEWKNQKERLAEQVNNFNGSTKRLKGGGRKMKVQIPSEVSDRSTDTEIELTQHLKGYPKKNELTPEIVLKEAKKINPRMKRGKEWAGEFLDDFLLNQPPPLRKRLDLSPPLRRHQETSSKNSLHRYQVSPKARERVNDYGPLYLDAASFDDDAHIEEYFQRNNSHHDDFFEKVEKDETNLVNHLVKWVQSFVDNYISANPIDMRTLHDLVFKEARKNAVVFDVTSKWVWQFLELNYKIYASKSDSKVNRDDNDEHYNHKENSEGKKVNNRERVLSALQNKTFSIHEWMDGYIEKDMENDV